MNLYLISQDVNSDYDTYDSFVVAAESEDDARNVVPFDKETYNQGWVRKEQSAQIEVELIGTAKEGMVKGTILGSFNAG